jgi:hypothetical protein
MLESQQAVGFRHVVTSDKSWVLQHYNHRQIRRISADEVPARVMLTISAQKTMLTVLLSISILYNSLQSRLVESDSMKPPQYFARRFRIKFNRRRHEHSCPNNSPIDVFRQSHEIIVRRLTPMLMTSMDLQGKRMTHHETQNIRSPDKLLSRSTGSRVQSMEMMDNLVDVMLLQEAAIFGREEVYVQTSSFLFAPSGR